MRLARITLYGWLQYDNTLFDDIDLPEGIDRTLLIDELIYRMGDLYTYIQQPNRLAYMIRSWFTRRKSDFDFVKRALESEYNPIENYNRYEDYAHKETENGENTATSDTSSKDTSSTDNAVSAYNSSSYTPRDRTNTTGTNSSDARSAGDYARQKEYTDNNHIHGNIGVTTTQAMILEELNLRRYNNIYDFIAECFEHEFIVIVY